MTRDELHGRYLQGSVLLQKSKFQDAEKHFDFVIENGKQEETIDLAYQAYKAKLFHCCLDSNEKALNLAVIMTNVFHGTQYDESLNYDLAQFYRMIGDHRLMINKLEQLIVQFPNTELRLQVLLELATAYQHSEKDFKKAIGFYNAFLNEGKGHPNRDGAGINLAGCYLATGDVKKAESTLKKYNK